ncbi:GNAT family N-acetyltransferase [Robiginitalea sp. M366]|uniref:GNAT family N-acetyltransferase n=1 Tax=Robiginitalea aestuariiviva TaxID=3036903 RepID=UPI00240D9AED|nr:GNAT family N-acetyltransferase [Robiginitalea aestuariiviva]MDG1571478.1 GNAT family N-acetyltransferase [Robiginitalea aestuariiviva]
MEWPTKYASVRKDTFFKGKYGIIPIRWEDREAIRQWRNEQIYHLRQERPLEPIDQDNYFIGVVKSLFEESRPEQYLFSYTKDGKCIGYGGLVHINWTDLNAEISFIMNTSLEENEFEFHWKKYLELIEAFGFMELGLHKLYVYAFDLRPHLYHALEEAHYFEDARLKQHCLYNKRFIDVVIHSKLNAP